MLRAEEGADLVIAFAVEKGGAGKTTTTGNLAAAMAAARPKRRVLCVDWDPQANLTRWLMPAVPSGAHIAGVVSETIDTTAAIHPTPWGFDLLAGHRELATRTPAMMAHPETANYYLRQILAPVRDAYDVVFVDCPPKLDLLSINALAAADALVIPVELGIFGADGLNNTLDAVQRTKLHLNTHLAVTGIVANKADLRTRHQTSVLEAIVRAAGERGLRLFQPPIPDSVVLQEACFHHVPIQAYRTRNRMGRECIAAYAKIASQLSLSTREVA